MDTTKTQAASKRAGGAKAAKDWQCQECGKRMTAKAAERAMNGADGCPKCGGADIDLAVLP